MAKGLAANLGLYSYPVLMASDILLFGGEIVPVGQDQKQHLEITRDIAFRFNKIYGDVFVIPEPDIDKSTKLIPGIDGQKMSKSYGNTIPIFGEEKFIRKTIMGAINEKTGSVVAKRKRRKTYDNFEIKEVKFLYNSKRTKV